MLRAKRDFGGGASSLGFMATAVNRSISDDRLAFLRTAAYAGGVDYSHRFGGGRYSFFAALGYSRIQGDTLAIQAAQRSSARYYQRPDADYMAYDPTRTALTGWNAAIGASKDQGAQNWAIGLSATSPGFEINDLGFQTRADRITASAQTSHKWTRPGRVFRFASVNASGGLVWNFGGDRTSTAVGGFVDGQFLNLNFGSGNKLPFVQRFAERGYRVLFVNVRRREPYPRPAEDAFCALSWGHAHAREYGLDPARIVAVGHSGGAVLAAELGTIDDRARFLRGCGSPLPVERWLLGVVSIAGIFDYRTKEEFGAPHNAYTPRYFGGTREAVPAVWAEASPITWADRNDPPFLLIHGTADVMVLPVQSGRSAVLMRRAGMEVDLVLVPDLDHSGILGDAALEAVERFIALLAARP